jgi:CHAT domain-containing protein
VKLDEEFTRDSLQDTLRKRYGVVHIASHFQFQPGSDANSFLLLGDGSKYSLSEFRTSTNLFEGVQLLTLSACNTGVGDAGMGEGKEVEAFGALAQKKGAKAVVASLWPVADQSTSLLMREFYRIHESGAGVGKAEALRRAQLGLLRGWAGKAAGVERALVLEKPGASAPAFTAPKNAPHAHPYYWAPFFLMGNWL